MSGAREATSGVLPSHDGLPRAGGQAHARRQARASAPEAAAEGEADAANPAEAPAGAVATAATTERQDELRACIEALTMQLSESGTSSA